MLRRTFYRNFSIVNSQLLRNFNSNVRPVINEKIGKNLHTNPQHPIGIIKKQIEGFFNTEKATLDFQQNDHMSPIVSTLDNFDSLLIPEDHVSRSLSDTYYFKSDEVLRTHTTVHTPQCLKLGQTRFLNTGDVYRRDEIDRTHYPVFHQMDGVRVVSKEDYMMHREGDETHLEYVVRDLKATLEGVARSLFGNVEMQWQDDYFPFTNPSFELNIIWKGEEIEVLGCGILREDIMEKSGIDTTENIAWAFGLGLDRLAMILFNIPDIRLFWTEDERFHKQFKNGQIVEFAPYSKYPGTYRDISFWVDEDTFEQNDFFEVAREFGKDLIEEIKIVDVFKHPKKLKTSMCFRILYRSMDRSLTNEEINAIQNDVIDRVVTDLNIELREGQKVV